MKKTGLVMVILVLVLGIGGIITCGVIGANEDQRERAMVETELPKPEVSGGMRGEMGIDKNINEETIDQYLGREDAVYRDMRMLVDEANYEAIGGDSYLSGFVEGFEVIPYPLLVNVSGLPAAVVRAIQARHYLRKKTENIERIMRSRWRFWNIIFRKIKSFS